ncbi:MAG: RsmD family RNA methyltransferase [Bacteroidota bacterium]
MEPAFDPLDARWNTWLDRHAEEPVAELALKYAGKGLPLEALLNQLKGRKISRHKIPSWYHTPGILYPDPLILEQCSSEGTARFKSAFARGLRVIDLTGGLGVDSWAFAQKAESVLTCEPDPRRADALRLNVERLGLQNASVLCTDAETAVAEQLHAGYDLVYLDPSRRSESGRKVYRIDALQPDVRAMQDRLLESGGTLLIKLAPMLDLQQGIEQLQGTYRIDVLSWKGECRELLFHLRQHNSDAVQVHAHDLESGLPSFHFQADEERSGRNLPDSPPQEFLFEPHAALRKSGARASVCAQFGLKVLHANTQVYTASDDCPAFPGTRWRLIDILPFKVDSLRERFGPEGARMVFYNFPETPERVMSALKLNSSPANSLFFVKLNTGKAAVLHARPISE